MITSAEEPAIMEQVRQYVLVAGLVEKAGDGTCGQLLRARLDRIAGGLSEAIGPHFVAILAGRSARWERLILGPLRAARRAVAGHPLTESEYDLLREQALFSTDVEGEGEIACVIAGLAGLPPPPDLATLGDQLRDALDRLRDAELFAAMGDLAS